MSCFPKSARLRTSRDYHYMRRPGTRSAVGQLLITEVRPGNSETSRLGITVSRRYGRAHERNRFKRLVREAFRLSYHSYSEPLMIHVKPRSLALKASFAEVQAELNALIQKCCTNLKR